MNDLTGKLSSARRVSVGLVVFTVCWGAAVYNTAPWLSLLANVASFLLGHYVTARQTDTPPPSAPK